MCHAPIVLPEVGGFRSIACAATTRAMHDVARRLLASKPDILLVISPHSPRKPDAWGIYGGPDISGDMGMFGAPEVAHTLPVPQEAVAALRAAAEAEGLETWTPPNRPLDHGAMVPLHFVVTQGWTGPTLLLSLPWPGTHTEATMGRAIARAAEERGERWSVLASGDMSHKLKPGAPSGFDPRAQEFDKALVDAITAGDLRAAANIPSSLRCGRGELGQHRPRVPELRGPLRRWIHGGGAVHRARRGPVRFALMNDLSTIGSGLPALARTSIAARLEGIGFVPDPLPAPFDKPQGVFVTLWTAKEQLRGCIGHIEPIRESLAEEVAECALLAAFRDPRFGAVTEGELEEIVVEVSVLTPTERVTDLQSLDPKHYGVVVSCGGRRGVLLPDIRGVDTVEQQLSIALRKGMIRTEEPWVIDRFEVLKFMETAGE